MTEIIQLHIDAILTTERCRYCLMCRHVCPITHVTRNEVTSPHGWGLLIASVRRGLTTWNEETVGILYHCADCGLCRAHCVTDQPLPLAINASRAEVVNRQLAPAQVYALRDKFQQWANPYVELAPQPATGLGEAALIVGAFAHHWQRGTVEAAQKLLAASGVEVVPIAMGRESPYLANSLGLLDEARQLGQATLDEIAAAGAKRVFVLSPGDVYSFQTILPALGLAWPQGIELIEVTTHLANQLEAGKLKFKEAALQDYAFFDPDQTVRVPGRWRAPRQLLAALSQAPAIELFWSQDRAAPSGANSALYFTLPHMSALLAQTRLAEAAERGVQTLITDDPRVLYHLHRQAEKSYPRIEVRGLFELLVTQLNGD
jgi:Fe-S oxidoreductase